MESLMAMESLFGKMGLFTEETIIWEKDREMVNFLIAKTQAYQEVSGKKES